MPQHTLHHPYNLSPHAPHHQLSSGNCKALWEWFSCAEKDSFFKDPCVCYVNVSLQSLETFSLHITFWFHFLLLCLKAPKFDLNSNINYRCNAYNFCLKFTLCVLVCVCVCGEETVPGNIIPALLKQTLTVEQSLFNDAQRQQGNNAHQ